MNTLMAGAGKAQRGRYTSAGYAYEEQESELYLERGEAAFKRELIRDSNRVGYSAAELDEDGLPFSFFIDEAQRDEERRAKAREKTRRREEIEELTFTERLARAMRREKRAVAVCCALLAVHAVLLAFWGQAMIDSVSLRDQIEDFEEGKAAYAAEIGEANKTIEAAKGGARVRNIAQNELGMLREELVTTKTIYIQTAGLTAAKPDFAQQEQEESAGLLDWLLSVADIFDFKRE